MKVYLDNAATTPMDPEVVERMYDILKNEYGNPSSIHAEGRRSKNTLEQARKQIAKNIGASPSEIVFMSGGTEANNTALKCAVKDLGVKRIISTSIEHHCVLHTLERLEEDGVEICNLTLRHCGLIHLEELETLLKESDVKTMVSIMFANNEIGTVYPIREIGELAHKYGAIFHSDSVQAVGHFPINASELPVDFITGAAHKFHGPKGVGFLYMNADVRIKPYIDGGAQERKMRAGTENISGIVGMALALDKAVNEMKDRRAHITNLRERLKAGLTKNFEGVQINGPSEDEVLYTVLSVSFPPTDTSDMLLMQLDIKGICVSSGSACSSGSSLPSHVIQSIREDDGFVTIRFSFSHFNTEEEIDFTLEQLRSLVPQKAEVQ